MIYAKNINDNMIQTNILLINKFFYFKKTINNNDK